MNALQSPGYVTKSHYGVIFTKNDISLHTFTPQEATVFVSCRCSLFFFFIISLLALTPVTWPPTISISHFSHRSSGWLVHCARRCGRLFSLLSAKPQAWRVGPVPPHNPANPPPLVPREQIRAARHGLAATPDLPHLRLQEEHCQPNCAHLSTQLLCACMVG